jgi:large subunit ribosomal protein L33
MRVIITLACLNCKQRNYTSNKNKRTHPDRMELKKFCKFCNEHTNHRETR